MLASLNKSGRHNEGGKGTTASQIWKFVECAYPPVYPGDITSVCVAVSPSQENLFGAPVPAHLQDHFGYLVLDLSA